MHGAETTRSPRAGVGEQLDRTERELHLRARTDQDHVGSPAVGVLQHVGPATDTAGGREPRAVERRNLLAGEGERSGPVLAVIANRHASTVSVGSAGRTTRRFGIARRAA